MSPLERIAVIRETLGYEYDDSPEGFLRDMLADLRHFAADHSLSYDEADAMAEAHFRAESLVVTATLVSDPDGTRFVEEAGLGPGQRRDTVTGGIAYSAEWLS